MYNFTKIALKRKNSNLIYLTNIYIYYIIVFVNVLYTYFIIRKVIIMKKIFSVRQRFVSNFLSILTFLAFCFYCIFCFIPQSIIEAGFKLKSVDWQENLIAILLGLINLFIFLPHGIYSVLFKKDEDEYLPEEYPVASKNKFSRS